MKNLITLLIFCTFGTLAENIVLGGDMRIAFFFMDQTRVMIATIVLLCGLFKTKTTGIYATILIMEISDIIIIMLSILCIIYYEKNFFETYLCLRIIYCAFMVCQREKDFSWCY